MAERVLLLMPTTTYKAEDFLAAAATLGVEVVVGTDRRQALEGAAPGHTLTLDFRRPVPSVAKIVRHASRDRIDAVIGTDDETTILAAAAAAGLGLRANPVEAVRATRDKFLLRTRLAAVGLRGPNFWRVRRDADVERTAREVAYPCVLKPLSLSASRGVLRADDEAAFVTAFRRIDALLGRSEVRRKGGDPEHLLVEDYLPGIEVALEGVLVAGDLRVLALFDKPDPLEGPTFEETLFVTPSRLPPEVQAAIAAEVAAGCRALGLIEGPVHAELRIEAGTPWLLEIAPRTIGGLCARTLRFGAGMSLEELVLRHALGRAIDARRETQAAGVMMLPTPTAGRLVAVHGQDRARAVEGIVEVKITRHPGARLEPLPEGHEYLGFIFARGATPDVVERSLREAHHSLDVEVD